MPANIVIGLFIAVVSLPILAMLILIAIAVVEERADAREERRLMATMPDYRGYIIRSQDEAEAILVYDAELIAADVRQGWAGQP